MTLAIKLRADDERYLEEAVKAGRYSSPVEIVAEALADWRAKQELRESKLQRLRAEIQLGLDQLDRGEGVEWDSEAVMARINARLGSETPAQ